MDLKGRILPRPDGTKYFILGTKQLKGNRGVCLMNSVLEPNKDPDYSMWNIKVDENNDKHIQLWPYRGKDSEELKIEILQKYVETAFEDNPEATWTINEEI